MTISTFEYLFLCFARFLLLNGINFPQKGMFKPEHIVIPFILLAVTPTGTSNKIWLIKISSLI